MTVTKDNFIFVYRLNDSESLELAQYYASKHNMDIISTNPSGNIGEEGGTNWEVNGQLVGISCSDNEILAGSTQFNNEIIEPLKDAINTSDELTDKTIWGIILGYNIPGGFYDGDDIISSTSRVSRMYHYFSKQIKNKLYNRNIFQNFDSDDFNFALICSRIDAPTLALAKGYIDNAEKVNKQSYANGTFYIDPYSDRVGLTADNYRDEILDFYNNTLQELNLDIWSTTFMDPYIDVSIPYVQDDSFVWSWFSDRSSSTFFQETSALRTFFYNADHDGAFTIRDINDKRWPILALNAGYALSAGSMSNPTNEGFLNPTSFFRSLINNSTIGEAYLFSLPYLDWTSTLFGDPLIKIGFLTTVADDETTIEENESWRRMAEDLAISAANLYKKESELYNILVNIVDLTSENTDTEIALLNSANDLYKKNSQDRWIGQLKPIVDKFLVYPERRFLGINNINDYLTIKEFKISRLLKLISNNDKILEDNLLDEGWWQFEFEIQDDTPSSFVNYYFILDISTDKDFYTIDISKNSSSIINWTYEKEKNYFTELPLDGIPTSYVGRRVRYESLLTEYLERGESYYFRITQYDTLTGEQYSQRSYKNIIYT